MSSLDILLQYFAACSKCINSNAHRKACQQFLPNLVPRVSPFQHVLRDVKSRDPAWELGWFLPIKITSGQN